MSIRKCCIIDIIIDNGDALKKLLSAFLTGALFINLILSFPIQAFADEYTDAMEERKSWPVQSNEIANWPEGPAVGAASALLMDADTGIVFYEYDKTLDLYARHGKRKFQLKRYGFFFL